MAEDKKMKRFKATTPRKRLFKLAGMSASAATNITRTRVKALFQSEEAKQGDMARLYSDLGKQVAQTLGEMKGAVMKVGQIASQFKDILPDEFAEQLERLQKDSPPMPFETIQQQLERELGAGPFQMFKEFNTEPFAAASIGQVHRAVTHDGTQVVVKIQYPGVEESCDSDLKQLRFLLKLGGIVKIEAAILDSLFKEIRTTLLEELDYINEARNLKLFHKYYEDNDRIVIPRVIAPLSSKRVLTMIYEEGDKLETARDKYPQETINDIGYRLFESVGDQIYQLNVIHADPHPGNFAFREDGTIIFYDFGAVKLLKPEVLYTFQDVLGAAMRRDYQALDRALIDLGIRRKKTRSLGESYYKDWLDIILGTVISDDPFDFGKSRLHDDALNLGRKTALKSIEYFQPSPDSMHVDRVYVGQYWNLVSLGANVALKGLMEGYLARPLPQPTLKLSQFD